MGRSAFRYSRLVLRVLEDPLVVAFDEDLKTSIDELFGDCRGDGGTTLEFLLLAAKPERLGGHDVLPRGFEQLRNNQDGVLARSS